MKDRVIVTKLIFIFYVLETKAYRIPNIWNDNHEFGNFNSVLKILLSAGFWSTVLSFTPLFWHFYITEQNVDDCVYWYISFT